VSERVLWYRRSETLLDVVDAGATEHRVDILAVFTDVTRQAVRTGDAMRTIRVRVYTQLYSTTPIVRTL